MTTLVIFIRKIFIAVLYRNMIPSNFTMNTSNVMASLATDLLGSASKTENTNFLESAFFSGLPVYYLQKQCTENSTFSFPLQIESYSIQQGYRIFGYRCC